MKHNTEAGVANSKLNHLPLAVAIDQVADAVIIASVGGILQYVNASFETITIQISLVIR